jgi:putative aldouronate transport system substrate-binding protein
MADLYENEEFGCVDCEDVNKIATAARVRFTRRQAIQGAAAAGLAAGLGGAAVAGAQDATPAASSGVQVDPTLTEPEQTYPLVSEPATLRVLIPSNPTVEDFATNEFTAWYEERTGVHIEWEVVPAATPAERDAALNLRLASGDYPDIIMSFGTTPTVTQIYGQQGVFIALNDFIEQHGPYTKRAFSEYPSAQIAATAADGNIYALPQVNDCFHCSMSQKLWINQEFLNAVGLEKPTTTDDYAEVLRQFLAGDPNGNGQADELPLTGSPLVWHGSVDEFFMNSFIYHPGHRDSANKPRIIVVDGQVTPIYTQDAWKEGIKYLASLNAEGLIDTELFTRDRDQLRSIGDGGGDNTARIGSVPAGWFGEFTSYDPEGVGLWAQYTTQAPLQGPGGVQYAGYNPYAAANLGNFIITNKCQNPELAFKWGDALGEIEATTRSIHGVKGRDWDWANEGDLGINGEQAIWKSITDIANVPSQNAHWSQSGPSFRSNAYRLGQYVPAEIAEFDIEVILFNKTNEDYLPYKQPDEMTLPPLYFTEEQAQFVAEVTPTIEAYVDETFSRAVTGQIDIEAEWENYKATLESMGLAQFITAHQEVYDSARQERKSFSNS